MAVAVEKKTATGECTVAVVTYIIACKLTMYRRTTRIKINTTTLRDECFTTELDRIDYHQLCAPFSEISNGAKCNMLPDFPSSKCIRMKGKTLWLPGKQM
jgi:hypothetical protein